MLDIRFVREHPDEVKENIKKKFQDAKLPLVDEVINLDAEYRAAIGEGDTLRANRNKLSKQIGMLMGQAKKDPSKAAEAEEIKKQVTAQADRLKELETKEAELQDKIRDIMYTIPQMIDPSVPIGPDDSCNVEVQRFGDPVVPDYPIPYHVDIMESFDGIDLDAAGRVSGNGFYYLLGDIARLHEAVLAYARDFMIDKGFTYVIPPFMMHGDVVKGVMSFPEMDAMMYKIEGEDLYLIGTSEHTMIGRFIDQTLDGAKLPLTLTSYSPCFRKEKGAHGIEERGIYRIHQFEKQEMIVVCKPEDSMDWYDKLWKNSVELFRSMEIPVRQLECCSGDLADLKVKSCDIEAWSPRQQKYFEVCSCSNLGDAQARRLHIRFKDENGKTQLAHTLNNTCVAPPRMLIAFLENHLQADGTVTIPEVLRPYMGGKEVIIRTLDIGADKQIGYFNLPKEDNPAMGMRALRICLNRPEIFKTQLRALYRASAFGKLGIMFPMVTNLEDWDEAMRLVAHCRQLLRERGEEFDPDTPFGVMFGVPSACLTAEEFVEHGCNFFLIETNDLTQYTHAVDRDISIAERYYRPASHAMKKLIRMVVEAAREGGIPVTICGSAVGNPANTLQYLQLGLRSFSVSPQNLIEVKKALMNAKIK